MRNIKQYLILLLTGLTLFFNIERLDFGELNLINIQSFVYSLAVVAVFVTILYPALARRRLLFALALWGSIYLFLKLFLFKQHPMIGGIYTYLSITELSFLILLVTLAHPLARALLEYLEAVEIVTLAKNGRGLPDIDQAEDLIRSEMNRSRHYNRSLSVITASLDGGVLQMRLPQFIQEAQEAFVHRYAMGRLAEITRRELRRMDVVLNDPRNGRIIVLSPESDSRFAAVLAQRIRAAVAEELGVNIRCGAASFPEQALTFEELVRQAEVHINGHSDITAPVKTKPV